MNELGDFEVPGREFRVTNLMLVTLAGLGTVLLATGLWLTFRYVPGPGGPWTVRAAHDVHRFAAYAFLVVAVMLVVKLVLSGGQRVRQGAAFVLAVAAVGSVLSGPKLAWDQLGLFAVTVGTNLRGVFHGHDSVKFILADGGELSFSSYNRLAWLHVVVIPLVIVGCGIVLAVARTRRRAVDATEPAVS